MRLGNNIHLSIHKGHLLKNVYAFYTCRKFSRKKFKMTKKRKESVTLFQNRGKTV